MNVLGAYMGVTVVVPVFNAAAYVGQAVESALAQEQTVEVLVIEDGSTDGSLKVCEALASEESRVRLLRHPGGENRGSAASRNLGLAQAKGELIAFLDADDYFLPDRMDVAMRRLTADPTLEGIYEAVEAKFESALGAELWRAKRGRKLKAAPFPVAPPLLFEAMLFGGYSGFVHTNGWLVRRSLFQKTGFFDENLCPTEDQAMWIKFAAVGKMAAGQLDRPVAIRRVHDHNMSLVLSTHEAYEAERLLWHTLWQWGRGRLKLRRHQMLMMSYVDCLARRCENLDSSAQVLRHMRRCLGQCPRLAFETYFWRRFRLQRRKAKRRT